MQNELNALWIRKAAQTVNMEAFDKFTESQDEDNLRRVSVTDKFGQRHDAMCGAISGQAGISIFYRLTDGEWTVWN